MSATQFEFQAAALALGAVLMFACDETDDAIHPTGFNDQDDLGQCTLEFTNDTGYSLTHGQFFPTDSFGILKELPKLPIADGDSRTMKLQVGVYEMKVNHQVFEQPPYYYFNSFDHACIKDEVLEVTATWDDLESVTN